MKRKLLYLFTAVLFTMVANAQRVWDISNNDTSWPVSASAYASGAIDGLSFVTGSGFGITSNKPLTWTDGYVSTKEFKSGGSSAGFATNLPTTRYFSFPVTGATTIKVWFRVNGANGRRCLISDGTTLLAEATTENVEDAMLLSYNYTGGAGTIYIFSSAAINYFKIESTDAALATANFNKAEVASVYTNGSQVYVTNLLSETAVKVYSLSGALVKSAKTASDVSFALKPGVYIVKAEAAEGSKSVKVVVN
ncbi:T9SS type A sorting domain-containing protein [Flavobacterium agrisoli]|uniref:T9SS type A sorting domain-containing protein n=1 Tax=Flavobacterium agrisoli TaxID=2793066 RepID=A0A934PM96_9FLAO|nr:T9SS type A sorting domain-containing protein [Flavobacterium agrisoli]MBK0369894.1 T9SS type A sorting domain-containing protein [Flavobacterium agrisoli]